MALLATQALLRKTNCFARPGPAPFNCNPPSLSLSHPQRHLCPCKHRGKTWRTASLSIPNTPTALLPTAIVCHASRGKSTAMSSTSEETEDGSLRRVLQLALWAAEAVYILWLFLLPYAPGDPVWAISSDTINALIGLSLNFFFILPLANAVEPFFGRAVGIRLIDAPVLHPMSEGLFNFVIGWTLMFAPLLFTDCKRDRYKSSLDILWGLQMFLTNTFTSKSNKPTKTYLIRESLIALILHYLMPAFLIPYMAIRLNEADADSPPSKLSPLGSVMTNGAGLVGLIGGAVCLLSAIWALYGRMDGDFGNITDRWQFLVRYMGSERLAYAFIWDIFFYTIFQPWLIGDNLQNVQKSRVGVVNYLRFIPVVGLVVYLLFLDLEEEQ